MTTKRKVKAPKYVPLDITFRKNWTSSGLIDSLIFPSYIPKSKRDAPSAPTATDYTLQVNNVAVQLNEVDVDNLLKQLKDVLPASRVLS